ncbi:CHAT domain-containing protein [Vibrio cholerae]|uniref:CHAT domain-containing protein n=1 Tax=Vibrio cholerae TaxID=666 RepID=UPI0011F328C2|nr:CHAT domain-containing protein [Vibrio cholerae]EGR2442641.1 CHAT domain-containing protein [Vibrio cholerae]EKB0634156.1 CHAT domain-containing protein [Vibrio cholerae]ELF6478326.1 CHAT domain-containing protein [Vibrio cholerae]ELN6894432.1 CHAT domain-containing protein [Vibrio cholerae]MCX9501292.1 CHAT domain-containing protein [Vibrio cholerae]
MLDTYRRNVVRKQNEIARLQQDKSKEQKKIADISIKINSAQQAIGRTKSESTIKTKLREIERLQKDLANTEKKIATLETKLSAKNKELINEQSKVSKEEEKVLKKQTQESERIRKQQEASLKRIGSTLTRHENTHREIRSDLERLKQLPEKVVVLFLAANPKDAGQLRLDEEARAITEMFRKAKHRDSVVFETRWAVQPMDVLQAINELKPTIVHFSGHGSDTDEIVFQDSLGNAKFVSKEAIVQTMMASSSDLRLVFFNTCFSFNQAEAVVQHVEAAIGMNNSIGDEAARVFASQFYSAIGFGLSLNKAFNQAKALVMMEGINEENTPQLFIQPGLDADELIIVKPEELKIGEL